MTIAHSHGPRKTRPCVTARPGGVSSIGPEEPSRWVRVTCPDCGVVRVRANTVVLRRCLDNRAWSYRARCSSCDTLFVGSTPASLALAAIAAGVAIELWSLPEPSPRTPGAPLDPADLLELHFALLEPDWLEQFVAVEPRDEHHD